MLPCRPKKLAIVLLFYAAIALTFSSVSEAKGPADVQRRDHNSLNRLVKKRSPQITILPPSSSSTPIPSPSLPPSSIPSSAPATSSTPTSSPTPGSSTAPSSSSSAASSTSSNATSSSSSSSTLPTPTPSIAPVLPTTSLPTGARTFITSTTVSAAEPTDTEPSTSGSMSKTGRTVITVLIAIAASVGGVVIIWTLIRKWKLKKSDSFEDRMQPIDWQPTMGDDGGLPVHRRASVASSFHSGSGHDANLAGYGQGDAYGTSDQNYGASTLGPLPDHDFTAGTQGHLAPVGGYADLSRGISSDPQMQEAYGHGPMAYGGYTTQDAYDYSGGTGARY